MVLYRESLTVQRELNAWEHIAESLEALAGVAQVWAEPGEAARLFGVAEALREAMGAPLPPSDRKEYDRDEAAVRTALGEEASATAWAEGRAMTLEQAIELALEELESPARPNLIT